MLYRTIISAAFLLTACAVTQSFSGDYRSDVLIRDQYIVKAKEVTTSNTADYMNRANTGDADAQMTLAYALTDVSDIPKDPARALQFVMMAAEGDNPFAQAIIIYLINRYSIKTVSQEYAFESALKSANKGNVFGIINAGTAYMLGNGVEVDLQNAYQMLTSAFALGHPDAISRLCFLSDVGSKQGNSALVEKLDEHRKLSHYDCEMQLPKDKAIKKDPVVVPHLSESNILAPPPSDSVSPQSEDEKGAQVPETKPPLPAFQPEEEPKPQSGNATAVKIKAKKGKTVASRSAKVNAKHKRRTKTKAKAKQQRAAVVKVAEEKKVAEAPGMAAEKQKQSPTPLEVKASSKASPEVEENHPKSAEKPQENATLLKDKVEPLTKPTPVPALLQVGQPLPNIRINTVSGQTVALEDYRGDVLLILFSETGCQSCRRHLPDLNGLYSKFGKQGLQIIGMSIDQDSMTTKFPLVHANETIKAKFGIQDVPVIFIVDAHGRVAGVFKGTSERTAGRVERLIIDLLRDIHKKPA